MKFLLKISLFALVLVVPFGAFAAVQSGGGYIVNGQVNPVTFFSSGGGYNAQIGGNPISGVISGSGYNTYGGGYFTPPAVQSTTPPASGGGGGGGGGGGASGGSRSGAVSGSCDESSTFADMVAITPVGYAPCRVDPFPDKVIDVLDFNVLMVNWSRSVGSVTDKRCVDKILADINCDGAVDILDFNLLMVYWGKPVFVIGGSGI